MGNAMRNSLAIDRRQSGTTLLEVLITVVLVSVGLLGLAGLQLATVQNTNSAGERFEATTLAQDILERMRANRLRALNGEYDLAMLDDPAGDDLVVATDLDNWMAALQTLPQGDGAIEVEDGLVTIDVKWTDASDDNAAETTDMAIVLETSL